VSEEFVTRHAVSVRSSAATLDGALRDVTFGEVPLVRVIVFVRGLGLPRREHRILDAIRRRATVVADEPGHIAVTLQGQFWRLRGRGPEPPATATLSFDAVDGVLRTETRVQVPAASRARFVRYWRIVKPFSGLIRGQVLRAAKRRAEAT
jgi:hypothetical protein